LAHAPRGVVEVGAGAGAWAALLRRACGARVDASDAAPPRAGAARLNAYHAAAGAGGAGGAVGHVGVFHDVVALAGGGALAARFAPREEDRALLLCWPPPPERGARADLALEALRAFARRGGATVCYVGETRPCAGHRAAAREAAARGAATRGAAARAARAAARRSASAPAATASSSVRSKTS